MQKKHLSVIVFLAGLLAIASFAAAQTGTSDVSGNNGLSAQGVTFPVAALGNCANQDACRAYCNDPANMAACTAFAQSNGLVSKNDAAKASKFAQILQNGGGPGGCGTPDACAAYCSTIANLDACVSFAKAHGFTDDHIAQGEKVLKYIQSGGKTPGGCDSQSSCQSYCSDLSHAEE